MIVVNNKISQYINTDITVLNIFWMYIKNSISII